MKYKYILFDMDGTVLDTLIDLANAVNHSLEHFSLPKRSVEEIRSFLGSGARQLIESSVPDDCEAELLESVLSFYVEWYDAHCAIETKPYPGILDLMEKLRQAGCQLAIISNKPHSAVVELANFYFPDLLELSVGEIPELRRKPWPDMVLSAMERLCAKKEECVYIGDSEHDIETAANAGLNCISVTWGFRSKEQLSKSGGSCFADAPAEIYNLIL